MFFKQKGFYISLACGIAAIGAFAALCINMNRSEQKEPVASASNPPQATAAATLFALFIIVSFSAYFV